MTGGQGLVAFLLALGSPLFDRTPSTRPTFGQLAFCQLTFE
jgi:hypothetical protein